MADWWAPILRSTTPSDNATGVSATANLVLTFSESVKAGSGSIKIYKSNGTLFRTISITDTSQVTFSGSSVIINPSVDLLAGTNYYVLIDKGAIKDLAGNSYAGISSTTAFNFATAAAPADTTAPLLTGTTPTDNATDVDVSANLLLTFNEAVKAGSGNIEIRNAADGSLVQSISVTDATKVTFSGSQLTINPGSDLSPETSYYVTFASGVVRDLAGNAFAGISSAAVFSFSTESNYVDTTAPIVLFTSPDGYISGGMNLVITFNEPMRAGTGVIQIRNAADNSLYLTIDVNDASQVSFSGRDVIINPTSDLPAGNYYVAIAPSAFEDLYGNDIDESFSAAAQASAFAIATAGATGYGASASIINAGAFASALVTASAGGASAYGVASATVAQAAFGSFAGATATGIFQEVPGQSDTIAGNDVSLDISALELDPALNGTLISVTSTRVDILGTDGLTYRIYGIDFNTAATTVAEVGGTIVSLIEAWAGFGASAHILYSHYTYMLGLPPPGYFDIAESLNGDDTIIGSSDDDILLGFTGDDVIVGRAGNDQLDGGPGYDTLKFASADDLNGDTVIGFEGGDKLDLSAIIGLSFIGTNSFSNVAGQVRYTWSGGNTILQIDNNGDGITDASLTLATGQFALGETEPGSRVFVLTNDVTAPVLISTSPADDATGVNVGLALNIYLTFNENVVAGSGEFEIRRSSDNSLIASVDVTNPNIHFDGYTVSFAAQGAFESGTGYYVTFASGVIQDVGGNDFVGISSPTVLNFTTADTVAPLLTSTSPNNNSMGVTPTANIVLTFSEDVQPGSGAIEIRDYTGGGLFKSIPITDATQVTFSGNQVILNPNIDLPFGTHFYVTMTSGVIKDTAGNSYAGVPPAWSGFMNFTTASAPDTTAPVFNASSPTDNEINVILDAKIALVFNERVVAGSGTIEIRHSSDGSLFKSIDVTDAAQVTYSDLSGSVVVNPTGEFAPGVGYYVTFGDGAFLDLAGNPAAGVTSPTAINFWTQGSTDTVVPTLSSMSPTDDATNVAVGTNLVLTFNEVVAPGPGGFEIHKSSDGSLVSATTFFDGNTVTLNPNADLATGTSYYVLVGNYAVRDIAGNYFAGVSSPTVFNFTTTSPGLTLTGDGLSNTLVGGAGNDTITGLGGSDTLTGGGGSDTFVYTAVSQSTSSHFDKVIDFDASVDRFDLWYQVTGVDAAITTGSLGSWGFDSNLASAVGSTKLAAHHAVLLTPSSGSYSGQTFLIVDVNGFAGYQTGADLVIQLGANSANLGALAVSDFV